MFWHRKGWSFRVLAGHSGTGIIKPNDDLSSSEPRRVGIRALMADSCESSRLVHGLQRQRVDVGFLESHKMGLHEAPGPTVEPTVSAMNVSCKWAFSSPACLKFVSNVSLKGIKK